MPVFFNLEEITCPFSYWLLQGAGVYAESFLKNAKLNAFHSQVIGNVIGMDRV